MTLFNSQDGSQVELEEVHLTGAALGTTDIIKEKSQPKVRRCLLYSDKSDKLDILTYLKVKKTAKCAAKPQQDVVTAQEKLVMAQQIMLESQQSVANAQRECQDTLMEILNHSVALQKVRI